MEQKPFGALKWAILHNQKVMVESLLDQNAPVDIPPYEKKNYRTPLHSSVYLGDLDIVKKLLERGASPNVYNINRETPLMLAAKFGKYDIVDLMLSEKNLENCANKENFTHLHIACMRNRVDIVRKLLEHTVNVNSSVKAKSVRWPGFTPLHFAVQYRSIETVKFLLSVGASITLEDSNQDTALHLADMARDVEIIDMILEAHENVVQNPINRERLSHFHIACTRNNPKIVERFIRNGVSLDDSVSDISLNWLGFTAIDFAIYYDCIDNVKLLLIEGGRKVFPSYEEKSDRLEWAYGTGNFDLVDSILKRDEVTKKRIDAVMKLPDLHVSCIYHGIEIIKDILTKSRDDLNTPLWQGSTPLHLAIERGDEKIIKYLIEQGAHCNVKNADGKTALHLAFERRMKLTVRLILENLDCIKEDHVDNTGLSHLHIACTVNGVRSVRHLIKLGADVNLTVNLNSAFWPGFTPLHFAAKFESSGVAQLLLEHGASYCAVDKNGLSAFDVSIFESCCNLGVSSTMEAILSYHSEHNADSFNDRGFSLLHALSSHLVERTDSIRKFLRDHPDDINKAVHNLNTPWDGYTPLHFAMAHGDPDHSELLIKSGADIFRKASSGDIPFHLSFNRTNRRSRAHIQPKIAMDDHDFSRMLDNPVGTRGGSLFHVACSMGNVEWITYFLSHGVDPNQRTVARDHAFGQTPLHLATEHRNKSLPKIVTLLLKHGASATARDSHFNTPLHNMMDNAESHIIELLISYGADVNARNVSLQTPLLSLCYNPMFCPARELSQMILKFLDRGADINLADEEGITPLSCDVDEWLGSERLTPSLELLLKHYTKLDKIGLFVSKHNREAFINLMNNCSAEMISNILSFSQQCSKERDLLMSVRVDAYTTLHDVLFKDLNGLSVMSENDEFQKILSANGFCDRFPIYSPMLKLQLEKGQIRKPLLSESQKILKSMVKISLPRECLERILQFLSNDDLSHIITSRKRS